MVFARGRDQGIGKMSKGDQKIQVSSYKINELGDLMNSMVTEGESARRLLL